MKGVDGFSTPLLQSLRDYGKLAAGARLLVLGASGGCGLAALQLARHTGAATIVAVCSGRNAEVVREHGATEVVDYTEQVSLPFFAIIDQHVVYLIAPKFKDISTEEVLTVCRTYWPGTRTKTAM